MKAESSTAWVEPGHEVLELGCGTGRLSRLMADRGAKVTAVDVSEKMLAAARENAPGVELLYVTATEIDRLGEGQFDRVVSTLVSRLPRRSKASALTVEPLPSDKHPLSAVRNMLVSAARSGGYLPPPSHQAGKDESVRHNATPCCRRRGRANVFGMGTSHRTRHRWTHRQRRLGDRRVHRGVARNLPAAIIWTKDGRSKAERDDPHGESAVSCGVNLALGLFTKPETRRT